MIRRPVRLLLLGFGAAVGLLALSTSPAAAALPTLYGAGSSWAQPAIDQWSKDVHNQGLNIEYDGNGSAAGRQDYTTGQSDFAGSDIAFLNGQDKVAGGQKEYSQYSYSYLPITAGGTAFMYQIHVNGKLVTDLRLSGDTITKIFTGQIRNWDDKQIAREYGRALPNIPIVPMIRSDPSGASFQFTAWMNHQYESQWDGFCAKYAGVSSRPCGGTEQYPVFPGAKAQQGSDQVANYVESSSGEGAIGYDEYSYAKLSHWPVVKVLNPAGYYTLPTASNVAIALQYAQINFDRSSPTYLMQQLDNVYTNKDPRSYPLSSYSYLIVPSTDASLGTVNPNFSAGKGQALTTWANYFLCGGQKEADALGYSPLPRPLVQGGIIQVNKVPNHITGLDPNKLDSCGNPTMVNGQNVLLKTAPYPSKCDYVTAPLYNCDPRTGKAIVVSSGGGGGSSGGGGGSSGGGSVGGGAAGGGAGGGSAAGGSGGSSGGGGGGSAGGATGSGASGTAGAGGTTASSSAAAGGVKIDPVTGKPIGATGGGTANATGYTAPPANAIGLTADRRDSWMLGSLTAIEIIAAVLVPPLLGTWLIRRRASSS